MHAKRQQQIGLIVTLIGVALFLVISFYTFVWANGLKFDSATGSFEKTAVIAVNNNLNDVTVSLNGKVVGNSTPLTLNNLAGGNYDLLITKGGFYPFEQRFQLSGGEAGVIKVATLIAQTPEILDVPTASYQPRDPFDVGLNFQNGQLEDYNTLVSRFANAISQAHRFNQAYLYQQGGDLHLFFPDNNQDFIVYKSTGSGPINLNLSPGDWSITVFDAPTPKQIFLILPNGSPATD